MLKTCFTSWIRDKLVQTCRSRYSHREFGVMSMRKMQGYVLECLQRLHDPIPLPNDTPVRLGRSPQTQITDPRCSRLQVEVQVSWATGEIKVTQLGANTSSINGRDLSRGETVVMDPDSTLFILTGMYPHKVVRQGDPPPSKSVSKHEASETASASARNGGTSQKRKLDSSNEELPNKKMKLEDRKGSKTKEMAKTSRDSDKNGEKTDKDNDKRNEQKSVKDKGNKTLDKSREQKSTAKDSAASNTPRAKPTKRESTERKTSLSQEEDVETHVKAMVDKLKQLKNKVKFNNSVDEPEASTSSKPSPAGGEKRKHGIDSPASSASGSDSRTKMSKVVKPASQSGWKFSDSEEKLCVFTSKGVVSSEKIAGFDIDGTIITTQSGRVFPKDTNDWKIMIPESFGKLKHLVAAGYKIVFFTNQLGVSRGKQKLPELQQKFENVVNKLQVPVQIFVSTHGGSYRKPATGMWQILKKQYNDGIPVNVADSLYVGDAAGRPVNWAPKKKKDFSCSDRLFALNLGLKFYTPEEYFLGHKPASFNMPEFDPRTVKTDGPPLQDGEKLLSDSQEVIVMVGFQASGKSSFAKKHLVPKGYVYVNQDTLKTWQKCVSECNKALAAGKSVVIDNTNVDPESRARYIDCARKAGKPCRCFFFDFSVSHCRHNERFRELLHKEHKPINEQIFNSTKSKFKPPEVSEGFTKVVKVNFVAEFESRSHEKIYRQFLLEK